MGLKRDVEEPVKNCALHTSQHSYNTHPLEASQDLQGRQPTVQKAEDVAPMAFRSYEDEDISDYRYGWMSNHSVLATWRNRQRFVYRTSPALCALDVNTTRLLSAAVPARSQPTIAMHRHWAIPFRERPGWRPHHSFMSSNQFGPTIYTILQDAGVPSGSPSAAFLTKRRKQQRAKERKKSREKTGGDCQRSQEDELTEKGDAGHLDPTTIISNHLKRKYEVESLDYGTAYARLKDTVITKTTRANRGSAENSIKSRPQRLDNIGNKTGTWLYHVLFAFYNLDQSSQQHAATKDPSNDYNQIVRDQINTYNQAGRTHPVLNGLIIGGLFLFLCDVSNNIEQAVQRHHMENIKVPVERVKAFNFTWASHAGRQGIASVNQSGVSSKCGNVAAFCLLNAQLPSDKRMKILPQTQFTDRFIAITGTDLLSALKHHEHVSQHTVKYLNLDKFTTQHEPCIVHPGDLCHRLFVGDKPKTTKSSLGDIQEVLTEEDYQEVIVDECNFRLLSMDPGIKDIITTTVFDLRLPNRVKNIAISQGSQLDPERKRKRNELEQSIKPIEYPEANPSLENDGNVWWALERSAEDRIMSIVKVARPLCRFYDSYQYKRNKRFVKLAQKVTLNKAFDRLLSQLSCKGKWVYDHNKPRPRPLVVAGDGEFGSRSGDPMSTVCLLLPLYQRDRDHNGAQNIERVVLQWLTSHTWPEELDRSSSTS
ncbi:MAG: hypothetical protein J3R72DRAFT_510847 [Linnemannia gamsii]|nr:MAG: hypothetical protein J3R72DRAFT_510847 [Linnemannia gamsii]